MDLHGKGIQVELISPKGSAEDFKGDGVTFAITLLEYAFEIDEDGKKVPASEYVPEFTRDVSKATKLFDIVPAEIKFYMISGDKKVEISYNDAANTHLIVKNQMVHAFEYPTPIEDLQLGISIKSCNEHPESDVFTMFCIFIDGLTN